MIASPPPGRDRSLAQMFSERARAAGSAPALRLRRAGGGGFVDVAWSALLERAYDVAAGLLTLPSGAAASGASVAIVASTRAEWVVADWAILSLGGVTVPVYPSLLAPETGYVLHDAAVDVVIVEDAVQLAKLRSLDDGFAFADVDHPPEALRYRHVVVVDPTGLAPAPDWESFEELEARGRRARVEHPLVDLERSARTARLTRADIATIAYTSGTTGAPKGVVQTHGNWLAILDVAATFGFFTERTRTTGAFLFLPLAHAFGRLVSFGAAYFSAVAVLSSPQTLLVDLQEARPGFVPAAPRVFEKMSSRVMSAVSTQPRRRQQIFAWALDVGRRTIPYRQRHAPLPPTLAAQHALAERLVFRKLRQRLGLERVDVMLSGSAPLAPAVHEFFLAIGVLLVEAYGMTETCPGISANTPERWKPGTVGPPLPGVHVRIALDGEVCVKGPNVTPGYHHRDDANAAAFDDDGWLHTGDIGHLDDEGFLHLTDRKKDLLKTSGGKYVAPQKIEGLLKARPLIAEAVVVGDSRAFCTVLLSVDDEALAVWAGVAGVPAHRHAPTTMAFLQEQVDAVNAQLASFETLKAFRVVDEPFTVESGLLTPSFKVKRKVVAARFTEVIDAMYATATRAQGGGA